MKTLHKTGLIKRLRKRLFENIIFDDALNNIELVRYQEANYYAARYCQLIELHYLQDFGSNRMVCELRRFYRLGQNAKFRRIENNPV